MKALFKSCNLIGDALYVSEPLRAWHREHPDAEITLLTLDDHTKSMYGRMGLPLEIVHTANEQDYDFYFDFNCSRAFSIGDEKKCHIAEAYAQMLGVTIETAGPYFEAPDIGGFTSVRSGEYISANDAIYVSPFSRSCSSHDGHPPNKSLPFVKWAPIMRFLRTLRRPIRLLGGPTDTWPDMPQAYSYATFSENDKILGEPLQWVAGLLRRATLLVTIDNGVGHLAASQHTPTVLLYPECLGIHWITHVGNPNAVAIQMNPATVHPALLLKKIKEVIQYDLKVNV